MRFHWFCLVCFGLCRKRGTFAATSPSAPNTQTGLHIFKQQVYTSDRQQARILRFSMYGVLATKEDGRGIQANGQTQEQLS